MKKLKPTSVRINWTGANASRNAFRSRFIPDKDTANAAQDALIDPSDLINSKELIDKLVDFNDNDIVGESIMGEITRLYVRCFKDKGVSMISWRSDTPTGMAMKIIDKCVSKILKNRTFTNEDTKYLIRYKIIYLLDVNEINKESKEALRLIGFIEYFIDKFTKAK